MSLTKEHKNKVISDYKRAKNDTGSAEVQIAVLTERINGLTEHFAKNKQDHHSRRGLLTMVSRRKKLIAYLRDREPERYKEIISRLNLRK